jgi:hypothetical protein
MKWSSVKPVAVAAAFITMGFMSPASADATLDQSSDEYLGSVTPGVPSSPGDEVNYINTLIDQSHGSTNTIDGQTYVRSNNDCGGPCEDAVELPNLKVDVEGTNSLDIGTLDIQYIIGKYDKDKAGTLVFYVGDLDGVITIPPQFNGHDISHIVGYYTETTRPPEELPEPATLALAGLGLLGAAMARRRKQH